MEIQSAFASGLQGFQQASRGVTEATANINNRAAEERNLEQERQAQDVNQGQQPQQAQAQTPQSPTIESQLVRLTTESNIAEANVRSIETADEVLGSLIDVTV